MLNYLKESLGYKNKKLLKKIIRYYRKIKVFIYLHLSTTVVGEIHKCLYLRNKLNLTNIVKRYY
jgi:hypothetical protein